MHRLLASVATALLLVAGSCGNDDGGDPGSGAEPMKQTTTANDDEEPGDTTTEPAREPGGPLPGEQPPPSASAPSGRAVTNVSPTDGSVGASPAQISVAFDLQREGGVDLGSVRLFVDGVDVTDHARQLGTDDSPQSRAELIYDVPSPLAEGAHRVVVRYRGGGKAHEHAWAFTVRS